MAIPDKIPGLGPRTERPRLNPEADLTAHRLTPVEGFVLSRVDGSSSYEEICLVSGIGVDSTLSILRRLMQEGLIMGPKDRAQEQRRRARHTTPVVGVDVSASRITTNAAPLERPPPEVAATTAERPPYRSLLERLDDGSPVDPADLLTGADLAPEVKMRIIRLHRRLKKLGPYEMLGLAPDAERAAIKKAYFAASKELHPDRYYGKDVGHFREKLGDIFARLTESFQSLDDKK